MAENGLNRKLEVLVLGGSAGSLEILLKVLKNIKVDTQFIIIIVLHRKNTHDSTLIELLASRTKIPVKEVEDKDQILPGHIYLAPADYHLLLEKNKQFSLDASEKINFSRPSIDVTFESVADVFGYRAGAILLSGANSDGTLGMNAIQKRGGTTIVQNPETAQVPYMPQSAISNVAIDYIFEADEMVQFINSFEGK